MKNDVLIIDFAPIRTTTHFFKILKNNVEAINYGIRLVDHAKDVPNRFSDEEEDFLHIQIGKPLPQIKVSENLKRILITKCFEDLIKGITLTLCDGYSLLCTRKDIFDGKIVQYSGLIECKEKAYKIAQGKSLPLLISNIEILTNNEFKLKKHILSINNARNCLMHRDGIVYEEKDINNEKNKCLEIKWISFSLFQIINSKKVFKKKKFLFSNKTPAFCEKNIKEKSFMSGSQVEITYKELLEISTTCFSFVQEFVEIQKSYLIDTKEKVEEEIRKNNNK